MTEGPDYIVASREGLYIVNHVRWRRVAEGRFFGVTVQGSAIYAFRSVRPSAAAPDVRTGVIVHYALEGGALGAPEILVSGLDHNCHQVDFFDGAFFVVDTDNQRVLEFDASWRQAAGYQILPPVAQGGGDAHINAFLGVGDSIHLMLHNARLSRPSEIVTFDRGFRERGRIALVSTGCHDIVRLEDGRLLYCDSTKGRIARDDGATFAIDELFTRGLAVGADEIAVGSSLFGKRVARDLLPGFVTFLDRAGTRRARLHVPAAPTQIRRLDGADLSLSRPRWIL